MTDKPVNPPVKRTTPVAKTTSTKTAAAKKAPVRKTAKKPAAPLKTGATRSAAANTSASTNTGASKAAELKDRALEKARTAATEGKGKASGAIGSLSRMIEESATTIDQNVGAKYGDYARSAADSVSSFAEKLDSKDVDQIVEDTREYVRQKPAIAIGAAAAVGFLVSRLIRSGNKKDDEA